MGHAAFAAVAHFLFQVQASPVFHQAAHRLKVVFAAHHPGFGE